MALKPSNNKCTTFLVWDSVGPPPEGDWVPVLWRRFGDGRATEYSVPRWVEEQADALRARFLGWVHDVGETQINGRRLVDHLALRQGFSYWWMTLLAEKSYAKSSGLYEAVKLLALEDLVGMHSAGRIILVSGDKTLARAFCLWCGNAGLAFELRRLKDEADPVSLLGRLYRSLPDSVQALVFLLRYLWRRWPLRRSGKFSHPTAAGTLTIVDYLFHLSPKALATGQFASNYWTGLIGVLVNGAVPVNWLHHYIRHEVVPTARQARNLIARFNTGSPGTQSHATLDSALGWSVIWGTVRDFCRLIFVGLSLRNVRRYFRPADSNIDLWPLFEHDWHRSIFGATAISNCLFLNLFEHTLRGWPHQPLGVYLQENQGWEMAFIHVWKAAGHGRLVAVPHSVVRYWDLRYFFDPRSYQRGREHGLPLPDLVALNGPAAVETLRKAHYPEGRTKEVEALRYLYLADLPAARVPAQRAESNPLRVLILSDYVPSVTHQQMRWLTDAAPLLPKGTRYIVRPHPGCPVETSDFPPLQLEITRAPLAELLGDCDVAYTSNTTAAAVDVYSAGIPLVSVLDGDAVNLSPLRGWGGVVFVRGPRELAYALRHAPERNGTKVEAYFCLDKQLPRWRRLLGLRDLEMK